MRLTRIAISIYIFSTSFCSGLWAGLIVTVFSSGYVLPESISLAPASFGLPPGTLVVADGGNLAAYPNVNSTIFAVPPGGGPPIAIGGSFNSGSGTFGGTFAPASFGSLGGDYLAFGYTGANAGAYSLSSPGGTLSAFYTDPNLNSYSFDAPVVAPSGFGSLSGDILAPEAFSSGSSATVVALSPDGSISSFATIPDLQTSPGEATGLWAVFAPAGFVPGTSGPVLLVSNVNNSQIDWIDSAGNAHLFATLPLTSGEGGLRQMAFALAGFGAYGGDLFVSVSAGMGTAGAVDVINSAGQLVGEITAATVAAPFDPRALYFESSSQLLIASTDPSIYSAPPAAITAPIPEPGTAALLLGVLAMAGFLRRQHRV